MYRPEFVLLIIIPALMLSLPGCKGRGASPVPASTAAAEIKEIAPEAWRRLASHGIARSNVTLVAVSPDTFFAALALDSTVRIQKGDRMWSDELPSEWYGERHPSMLYLYDIDKDTLVLLMEFDQIVDFYNKKNAQPVEGERKESFAALSWSPKGRSILVVKNHQESNGRSFQNALIFNVEAEEPVFLDLFGTWETLVRRYQDSPGTRLVRAGWLDSSRVRIVLAVVGIIPEVQVEVVFDATTGQLQGSRELSPS